jgi:hypothetical protein
VEGSCGQGNVPPGSIKCWEILEWLHNWWLSSMELVHFNTCTVNRSFASATDQVEDVCAGIFNHVCLVQICLNEAVNVDEKYIHNIGFEMTMKSVVF